MIHQIVQGKNPETGLLLYFLIGPLLTDEAVHTSLGSPVTSRSDDVWYINITKGGEYRGGFAVVRYLIENGKEFHVRHLYAPERYYEKRLVQKILEDAAHAAVPTAHAHDYTGCATWSRSGFDLTKYSQDRSPAIWTKTVEPLEI